MTTREAPKSLDSSNGSNFQENEGNSLLLASRTSIQADHCYALREVTLRNQIHPLCTVSDFFDFSIACSPRGESDCIPEKLQSQSTILYKLHPVTDFEKIVIIRQWLGREIHTSSPKVNENQAASTVEKKQAETTGFGLEPEKSEALKISQPITPEPSITPRIASGSDRKKKSSVDRRVSEDELFSCCSKTSQSLMTKKNGPRVAKSFAIKPDSDETDCELVTPARRSSHRKSVLENDRSIGRSMKLRSRRLSEKKNGLFRDRDTDLEAKQSRKTRISSLSAEFYTSGDSSDELVLTSDNKSDTASDTESASSRHHRIFNMIERQKSNRRKRNCSLAMSRNFLPSEQHQMVRYLIRNKCIASAKGYSVWQQMLLDGFLQHRTVQSLNNHFRRFILPKIHRFDMKKSYLEEFQKLQN